MLGGDLETSGNLGIFNACWLSFWIFKYANQMTPSNVQHLIIDKTTFHGFMI